MLPSDSLWAIIEFVFSHEPLSVAFHIGTGLGELSTLNKGGEN